MTATQKNADTVSEAVSNNSIKQIENTVNTNFTQKDESCSIASVKMIGKSKKYSIYRIYNFKQNLRDTAHRINGVERPKPNEGYALQTVSLITVYHLF